MYDGYKCIGCRYCMMACPFAIPSYEWGKVVPYVRKCDFCYSRISSETENGQHQQQTACTSACPTGTLQFGDRDELIEEARRRQLRWPGKYLEKVYGKSDAGGTSWIYLSDIPYENLGFPDNIGTRAYPDYTRQAIDMVPMGVTGSGLALAGLYWLYKRKQELAAAPDEKKNREGLK